tara:strand:- start:5654 stop:6007 length:354 start_codon:yes stop_codon:yes gene_type:complete
MRIAHISELEHIKDAAGSTNDYAEIRQEIATSRALLVEHMGCYCVLRLDADGLVVVCAQGANLNHIAPLIVRLGQRLKAGAILFHTKRPALKRLLRAYPFKFLMHDNNGHHVYRMAI